MFLSQNMGLGMGMATVAFALIIRLLFVKINIESVYI